MVVRRVVDNSSGDPLTESAVLPSVHKKSMPADIHLLGRGKALARIVRTEFEEPEGLVHDGFGLVASFVRITNDAIHKSLP